MSEYPKVHPDASHTAQFRDYAHTDFNDVISEVNGLLAERGAWYSARYGMPFIPHMDSPVKPDAKLASIEGRLAKLMPSIISSTKKPAIPDESTSKLVTERVERANVLINHFRGERSQEVRAMILAELRQLQAVPASLISSPHVGTRIVSGAGLLDHPDIYQVLPENYQHGLIVSGHLITVPFRSDPNIFVSYFVPQREEMQTGVWTTSELLTAGELCDTNGNARRARFNIVDADKNTFAKTTRPNSHDSQFVGNDQVTVPVYTTVSGKLERSVRAVLVWSDQLEGTTVQRFSAAEIYEANKGKIRIR